MAMTRNEKKLILSLGKIAVKQIHFSALLLANVPAGQKEAFQKIQEQSEAELDNFINLISEAWGGNEEN